MQHCYALFLCFAYCIPNTLNKILLKIKFSFKVKLRVPEYFSILKVEKKRRKRRSSTDVSTGQSGRCIFSIKAPASQMPLACAKWTKTIQERP